jgi:hypothetical protein
MAKPMTKDGKCASNSQRGDRESDDELMVDRHDRSSWRSGMKPSTCGSGQAMTRVLTRPHPMKFISLTV